MRLVDDRLGVVIELPTVETVVEPGDTLCNTDIGEFVSHEVTDADIGTTIVNNALVTVRTMGDAAEEYQAAATAEVVVSDTLLGHRFPSCTARRAVRLELDVPTADVRRPDRHLSP